MGAERPYLQKVRTTHSAEDFLNRAERPPVYRDAPAGELDQLRGLQPGFPIPWDRVNVIARRTESEVWVGTDQGAVCLTGSGDRTEYFAGRRWLPNDRVTGFAFDPVESVVWIETESGFSAFQRQPMTLEEKALFFQRRVRTRHVRHGLTSASRLDVPGDPDTNRTISSDNDGLWTAMYLASECFRYRVTGAEDALNNARQALQALIRLEEITPIPGFPARSFIEVGRDIQPSDGEWHDTADGRWRWKGDTSSDEIVGHYFAHSVYFDLAANEEEKTRIATVLDRITTHILDHGYHLVDLDGKPTRWGWWAPGEIWADPDETGLRALHILSHLQVALHTTRSEENRKRYEGAYRDLIDNHRYHLLTRNQKICYPGHVNHSDDELAFLSYYPLLLYERDPELRRIYVTSLERSWQVERPERNPLWNFIYAAATQSREFDQEASIQTLREIPMDLITWTVSNSQRIDIPLDRFRSRLGELQALVVLPYDELPVMKWNGNPYRVDGGNGGRSEDDGAYFLLPYWMGRYHSLLPDGDR